MKSTDDIHDFGAFFSVSLSILRLATMGISRVELLREMLKILVGFCGCDTLGLRLENRGNVDIWAVEVGENDSLNFTKSKKELKGDEVYLQLAQGHFDPNMNCFTKNGSLYTGDTGKPIRFISIKDAKYRTFHLQCGVFKSLLLIPIRIEKEVNALLILKSKKPDFFNRTDVELFEWIAQISGVAVLDQQAQAALKERVKELSCLYGISQIARQPELTLEEVFRKIVGILPPAFQYPELAAARIWYNEQSYQSSDFTESPFKLVSPINVNNIVRGYVEVYYTTKKFEFEDNPFLEEEQKLIDGIAKQISLIIEGRKAEDEKRRLEEQLRHADRLATIGELAAGVAHELNEPLGNILGFAQLARKSTERDENTGNDLEKIIQASLHAREIVKKLLIFARQVPARKSRVNLNRVVEDGLYFLESRCAREGIKLEQRLCSDLPDIVADAGQLNQVLVNLVVNAIQAMPKGGSLTVQTKVFPDYVGLEVDDTGIGMTKKVKEQIFLPFFTTKGIREGTGLGLAVVHGIVLSHGGKIEVYSTEGKGSRFLIRLPIADKNRNQYTSETSIIQRMKHEE